MTDKKSSWEATHTIVVVCIVAVSLLVGMLSIFDKLQNLNELVALIVGSLLGVSGTLLGTRKGGNGDNGGAGITPILALLLPIIISSGCASNLQNQQLSCAISRQAVSSLETIRDDSRELLETSNIEYDPKIFEIIDSSINLGNLAVSSCQNVIDRVPWYSWLIGGISSVGVILDLIRLAGIEQIPEGIPRGLGVLGESLGSIIPTSP